MILKLTQTLALMFVANTALAQVEFDSGSANSNNHSTLLNSSNHVPVQRIVIFEFEDQTGSRAMAETMTQEVLSSLRRKGCHEFISPPKNCLRSCGPQAILRGGYSESALVDAYYTYNADAVLVASLNEYDAFGQLKIGVTIHVVNVRTAEVLTSLNRVWSNENPATREGFEFYISSQELDEFKASILKKSPSMFAKFVANEIANRLCESTNSRWAEQRNSWNTENCDRQKSSATVPFHTRLGQPFRTSWPWCRELRR